MNYFIGDLHLFNRNQTGEGVNYDGRPFATVAEMNQYILEHWNAKITNGDTVYILGDMAMRGRNEALIALVAQLKGQKILFRGNHDDLSDYRYQKLFADITDYREISESFDGQSYKLCLMLSHSDVEWAASRIDSSLRPYSQYRGRGILPEMRQRAQRE